jgi:hypothetical protein
LALSSVRFNASGVLMSGFGAPARTATPIPTRATVGDSPAANVARAGPFCMTSTGTIPRSNGPPAVILMSSGVVP